MNQYLNFSLKGKVALVQVLITVSVLLSLLLMQNKALLFVLTTSTRSWWTKAWLLMLKRELKLTVMYAT